jgi:hypothetical protein
MTGAAAAISRAGLAAAACAAAFALARPAAAQDFQSIFTSPQGAPTAQAMPPVARFVSEDGDGFILDRSQPQPLLKFDNSFEVWVLTAQPAPRGDVIFKNDAGEPVLRATRLGGITIFTEHNPQGEAAALAGVTSPFHLVVIGPQALGERLVAASARASHAARHLITFDAEATPPSSGLIADAAMIVSEAVVRISRKANAAGFLARLQIVKLREGHKAQVQLQAETLSVTVAPEQGVAGRPSSERIMKVAMGGH